MKIITWNVNGIRAVERKEELQHLIQHQAPDVLLLQETKAQAEQLSDYLTQHDDYIQHYHSAEKKGYAGTSAWIERSLFNQVSDFSFNTAIPHAPNADEGRTAHLQFTLEQQRYDILGIYFPNGGKSTQAWEEKLVFYERTFDYMQQLDKEGSVVIVGGDMNVAHTPIDLARPKDNDGKIGFHPKERAWMDKLLENDWIDAWREQNPDVTDVYSWWTMRGGARDRNVGWRIDYFLLKQRYAEQIENISYQKQQLGSDHCPLSLTFDTKQR